MSCCSHHLTPGGPAGIHNAPGINALGIWKFSKNIEPAKEAEYAHARGWPSRPNDAIRRVENNYILPDMVAQAINGMPTKRALEWAQAQVVQALKGQLKPAG